MTDYEKRLGCYFPRERSDEERISHYKIIGSCLEKIGVYIPNGGVAFADSNLQPQVGDLAIILPIAGSVTAYIKEIQSIDERGIITRTRYTDPSKDFTIKAGEYLGTVLIVTDRQGKVIWESKREHAPLARCPRCKCFYKSGARHRCKASAPFSPLRLPCNIPFFEDVFPRRNLQA